MACGYDRVVCVDKACQKALKAQGYNVNKTVRDAIHDIMGELYPEVEGGPKIVLIHPNAHDVYDPKLVIPKGLKVRFVRKNRHT